MLKNKGSKINYSYNNQQRDTQIKNEISKTYEIHKMKETITQT